MKLIAAGKPDTNIVGIVDMSQKREWTHEEDQSLLALRAQGKTWEATKDALGIGRNSCIDRVRLLQKGQRSQRRTAATVSAAAAAAQVETTPYDQSGYQAAQRVRETSWRAITAGTLLEGVPFSACASDCAIDGRST